MYLLIRRLILLLIYLQFLVFRIYSLIILYTALYLAIYSLRELVKFKLKHLDALEQ